MKYAITGSLGNISKPIAESLLKAGHEVTIITSNHKNESAIKTLGAKPAVGWLEDVKFLNETFKDHDAVYTMIPPKYDADNWKSWIVGIGKNYATAIKDAGIEYVVNLSSWGAHMPDGAGPISGLHYVEAALNELEEVSVIHLRPGSFYTNLFAQISMIKNAGIMGANYGEDAIGMVHPKDIAKVAAEELLNMKFSGKSVRYIAGDEKTGADTAKVLGDAINKPGLQWIVFSDEQFYDGAIKAGLPEEVAKNYTEMGKALRTGEIGEDYNKHKPKLSDIRLEDFAKEFEGAFDAA